MGKWPAKPSGTDPVGTLPAATQLDGTELNATAPALTTPEITVPLGGDLAAAGIADIGVGGTPEASVAETPVAALLDASQTASEVMSASQDSARQHVERQHPEDQHVERHLLDSHRLDTVHPVDLLPGGPFHDPIGAHHVRRSINDTGRVTPYLFPSDEWAQAWVDAFNANPQATGLLHDLAGRWRFEVERDRTGPDGTWEVLVDTTGARLVDIHDLTPADDELRGVVRASHDRWNKLFCGKADLRMSILTRRVHVSGDLKELRAIAGALVAAGFSVNTVPTMFLCDT